MLEQKPGNKYLLQAELIHNLISEIDNKLGFITNIKEEKVKEPLTEETELGIAMSSIIERLIVLNNRIIV